MSRILIITILSSVLFYVTHAATSCYSCTNCGTEWDVSKASIVTTSKAADYCRKTVTATTVNRDFASSCVNANVLGNGVYCCQSDLCNSANRILLKIIHLAFLLTLIYTICHYAY